MTFYSSVVKFLLVQNALAAEVRVICLPMLHTCKSHSPVNSERKFHASKWLTASYINMRECNAMNSELTIISVYVNRLLTCMYECTPTKF